MIEKKNSSQKEFIVSEVDGIKRIKLNNINCKNDNCCNNYILDVIDDETGLNYIIEDSDYPAEYFKKGLPFGGPNSEKYYLSQDGKDYFKLQKNNI